MGRILHAHRNTFPRAGLGHARGVGVIGVVHNEALLGNFGGQLTEGGHIVLLAFVVVGVLQFAVEHHHPKRLKAQEGAAILAGLGHKNILLRVRVI